MSGLIANFPYNGVITVNRIIIKPEFSVDELQERVAELCENVKTYHSDTGFVGGFVALNSGRVSNEGSTIGQSVESSMKEREALIMTFWDSFDDHERSHRSDTFQPLFEKVLELCENGNEEIAYEMLWSGLQPVWRGRLKKNLRHETVRPKTAITGRLPPVKSKILPDIA